MRPFLICFVGAVSTGVLIVFAMPPASQGYLAWFAIAPVLLATKDRGIIAGFLSGISAVFVAAGLSLSGVPYAITGSHPSQAGLPAWTFSAFGIYGFAMAISVAIFADKGARKLPCWSLAAIATLLESVLLFLLPANLGLTQYRHQFMLLLASVGGIWVVSYLVWYVNFVVAAVPRRWFATLGVVAILTAISGVGSKPIGETASVACIQIAEASSAELEAKQRKAANEHPEVVVWPELSGIMLSPGGDTTQLKKLSAEYGTPLVTSFRDDFEPKPHNAASLFANGSESARYYKRRLFGGEKNMHTAGTEPVAVPWGHGELGLAICYDSCFPEAMRETALLPRVTAIALPTIDPESPSDFFAACHARLFAVSCCGRGSCGDSGGWLRLLVDCGCGRKNCSRSHSRRENSDWNRPSRWRHDRLQAVWRLVSLSVRPACDSRII